VKNTIIPVSITKYMDGNQSIPKEKKYGPKIY
jgi:hypothetical protein